MSCIAAALIFGVSLLRKALSESPMLSPSVADLAPSIASAACATGAAGVGDALEAVEVHSTPYGELGRCTCPSAASVLGSLHGSERAPLHGLSKGSASDECERWPFAGAKNPLLCPCLQLRTPSLRCAWNSVVTWFERSNTRRCTEHAQHPKPPQTAHDALVPLLGSFPRRNRSALPEESWQAAVAESVALSGHGSTPSKLAQLEQLLPDGSLGPIFAQLRLWCMCASRIRAALVVRGACADVAEHELLSRRGGLTRSTAVS